MSAVIQNEYTGNGSTTTYSFTFPYLKTSDIKASLDGVDTTAFTLPNATTLQFNTAPTNGAKIKIFRQTSVDNLTATFYAGSAIKSEDLNDNFTQNLYKTQEIGGRFISALGGTMTGNFNMGEDADIVFEGATDDAHETTLTVADPTADRTITLPNVTGTVVTTGDTGTVATAMIAGDAVNGTKIADDSINSEHYVDGSIDTQHIADAQVTTAKIADSNVTTDKLANNAVTTAKIANDAVTNAKIGAGAISTDLIAPDAVTNAKIADNSINSEHYVDGSILANVHLADNSVTLAKMADDSVGTAELVDGSVDTARLADNSVTLAKMTDTSVGTAELVDDAVTSNKIADGVIDTVHIGNAQVTTAKIAASAVNTSELADAGVTSAKIANDAITIGKLGCEQTTLSDSDSHIPTSGAVVDYVAAQLAPLGGFEAIANEQSFPNTQPASGVVISIADAGGLAVSNSGTASGQTVGGTTVNITGIASNFNGTTVAAGIRFLVASTGSGQNYTYHKATLKEDDLLNLSGDINDFAERYRVGSNNPTSSLDNGDLFFNTSTGKMLVYNGTNTAWEEVQSIGNFFISTLSPAFDGSTQNFTITNAPSNVQQILLVINGVVQKPNSGTSTPSEGFALDGSTIKLGAAPATGSTYHAVVLGSTVNIGTPSNNTVSTAILQDDSVTSAKIAASSVTATELGANAVITSKIADDTVTTAKIADDAVTHDQLANHSVDVDKFTHGTSSNNGKYLRATNGNHPTWETVNTDLVSDTSPQLGGTLASNTHDIHMADNDKLFIGTGQDMHIFHDGTNSFITSNNGYLQINAAYNEIGAKLIPNGAVELYYDNAKKFETRSGGVTVQGQLSVANTASGGVSLSIPDNTKAAFGTSDDLKIYHDGSHTYLDNNTGHLYLRNHFTNSNSIYATVKEGGEFGAFKFGTSEWLYRGTAGGSFEAWYDGSKKFETLSDGIFAQGKVAATGDLALTSSDGQKIRIGQSNDIEIYHDGSNSYISNSTGNLRIGNTHNNNIIFRVSDANKWHIDGNGAFLPDANNTYDIGTTSNRVRNIYTNDLHLSNKGHTNSVDGTWGDWTIQEGESDLFLKNNRSGKKYKFNLTEVS